MLETNIFSVAHNIFYPFQNKFQILSHINFVVIKSFYSIWTSLEFGHLITTSQKMHFENNMGEGESVGE